ncbi:BCCT family transporter [Georgenia satyanarayanai]|uniref:BCCT family transporter n=1 Tax=Georgenia satyanarayanai TaxID=860221 RepID=UPI00203F9179|nr:BCCT family transporter [Georgenia satyanarayanai]MCM3659638.1 BCCT family transporter [Georgenia satyanarayanai]
MKPLDRLHDALGLRTSPRIFFPAALVAIIFVVGTILFTEQVDAAFAGASGWIMSNLGWFYILGVTVFLLFLVYLAASRFGRVRLGDQKPEHSGLTWFAMLFAAGIGSILMFWGVAEPINHYANPPMQDVEGQTQAAAREAIAFTLYHFGLHTWAIFALPALGFAYFMYRRNLPPRVSSIFQPLLGEKIHGPVGAAIDVVAVVGTIFGVGVSVGLGTLQINSGLNTLWGLGESRLVQVLIIVAVSAIAVVSVSVGLEKGIKRLSNLNIILAVGLLCFVVATGPTLFLVKGTIESVGIYASALPQLAFWNDTAGDSGWQNQWTVFYWAWTISWSPFTGIFIAKISKGRTIRQFVSGVLAAPVLFSIVWFGVFGWASFGIEQETPGELVGPVVEQGDVATALFVFLEHFPLTTVTQILAVVLVVIFFTTSVDSAGLVIDSISNGYEEEAPVRQRVFWTIAMGAVAATMLAATGEGGLAALQQVIIVVGLPFFIIGYVMIYTILAALKEDAGESPPVRALRWRRVLPPEEAARRTVDEEYDNDTFTVVPEIEPGQEPIPVDPILVEDDDEPATAGQPRP